MAIEPNSPIAKPDSIGKTRLRPARIAFRFPDGSCRRTS